MANLSAFTGGGGSLATLPVSDIGQTSSNQTLDLTQASVFELEPTADITINVTGLATGARARGFLTITNGGEQTLTWQAGGSTSAFVWNQNEVPSLSLKAGSYDVSNKSFAQSFDISSNVSSPGGITWKPDGNKVYVTDNGGAAVTQYSVSTPYDISTATYESRLDVGGTTSNPKGMAWDDTGDNFYIIGVTDQKVSQYSTSTPFDVSSGSFLKSLDLSAQSDTAQRLYWKPDGTRLFTAAIGNNSGYIHQYDVSTPFDVSTATFSKNAFARNAGGVTWSSDGYKLFVINIYNHVINEYDATTPFDVGSITSVSQDGFAEIDELKGMAWNIDGTKLFISGVVNSTPKIFEYQITGTSPQQDIVSLQQLGSKIVATLIAHEVDAS